MSDEALFRLSETTQLELQPFTEKQIFQVNDFNNGSYNGQIKYDTTSLSSSEYWLAFSQGYIQIPFNIVVTSAAVDLSNMINSFSVALKNGYYQIIDSIQVSLNGQDVVQQTPFTNFYVNYKLMTSMDWQDVDKIGAQIGFNPDSSGSHNWSDAKSQTGEGICNNNMTYPQIIGAKGVNAAPYNGFYLTTPFVNWTLGQNVNSTPTPYNEGLYKRAKNTAIPQGSYFGYGNLPTINTLAEAEQIAQNSVRSSPNGAGKKWQWTVLATIRLCDICDWFDKVPLAKNTNYNITINYNSSLSTLTATAPTAPTDIADPIPGTLIHTNGPSIKRGNTCPVMVASASSNNPNAVAIPTNDIQIACGVGSDTAGVTYLGDGALSTSVMYVPAYKFDPEVEKEVLNNVNKEIVYTDISQYQILNVGVSGTMNSLITNGAVDARSVIIMPFITAAANSTAGTFSPWQSVFDTAPAQPTPQAAISNLQISFGGQNLFNNQLKYDFQAFYDNVYYENSLDGNVLNGSRVGLIDFFEWQNGYRYYVGDLRRLAAQSPGAPKSIQIYGQNASGVAMDYYIFVESEKRLVLNRLTGQVTKK